MRVFSLSTWIMAASLWGGTVIGACAASKLTYADIAAGTGNRKGQAVAQFLVGTTRLFHEKGGKVSVYFFRRDGKLARAISGETRLVYGTWTVRGQRNPKACLAFKSGPKVCYGLRDKALAWEAGACEANKFGLSFKSGRAPKAIGSRNRPKALISACQTLSSKRVSVVRKIGGVPAQGAGLVATKNSRVDFDEATRMFRKLFAGSSRMYPVKGGWRMTYYAPNGQAYSAFSGRRQVVKGRWFVDVKAKNKGRVCLQYTRAPAGIKSSECLNILRSHKVMKAVCYSDLFRLSRAGANPLFGRNQKTIVKQCKLSNR